MILALALLAASASSEAAVAEARHALERGRAQQAREMIGRAVAAGASGAAVDRLLADLALVEGRPEEALARFEALIATAGSAGEGLLYQQAGLAALRSGKAEQATVLLQKAVALPDSDWRARNALGVALDRLGRWEEADRAYAEGLQLAPGNGMLHNNQGWSLLLRGRWEEAHGHLVVAAAALPDQPLVRANLDLARAALSADLPARRPGESGEAYAARLNDAGVVAYRQGRQRKAVAAFARAIEASGRWFPAAAANLALAERDGGKTLSEAPGAALRPAPGGTR
jgi:Flp pilus assembly protein TadD